MRYVVLGKSATIVVTLAHRPGSAGTAVVRESSGGALETITPSLDSVSTTITADVAAGRGTLAVASATGITRGRRYLLDGPEDGGGEQVTVTGIASTTLTLARVLRRAHANASTLVSTRLSFAVTTTSTTNVGRNLRIEWTDPDTSDVVAIPFDVVRWSPLTTLTAEDLPRRLFERGLLAKVEAKRRTYTVRIEERTVVDGKPGTAMAGGYLCLSAASLQIEGFEESLPVGRGAVSEGKAVVSEADSRIVQ